jgi:hypothetical protein
MQPSPLPKWMLGRISTRPQTTEKMLWHCGISTLLRRERTPRDLAAACRQRARTRDSSERASQLVVAPFPIVID